VKRQALSHIKTHRLMRLLQIPLYQAVGLLEVIWCHTEEHYQDGALRGLGAADIAALTGWQGDEDQLLSALVDAGWLDRLDDGTLLVHDWHEHCADHVHARLARLGSRFANGAEPRATKLGRRERHPTAPDGSRRQPTAPDGSRRQPTAPDGSRRQPTAPDGSRRQPTQDPRPKTQDHVSGESVTPNAPLPPNADSPPPLANAESSCLQKPSAPAADRPAGNVQPPPKQNQPDLSPGSAARAAAAAPGAAVDAPSGAGERSASRRQSALAMPPSALKISAANDGLQKVGDFAVEVTRRMLREWMERHADRLPPPDDEICRLLLVAHGMSLDRLRDWLLWLRRRGKRPESVQSWGWFIHLASVAETSCAAAAAG
jgi:hypothetical protein